MRLLLGLLLPSLGFLGRGALAAAGGSVPPALPPNWVAYHDPQLGKAYVSPRRIHCRFGILSSPVLIFVPTVLVFVFPWSTTVL